MNPRDERREQELLRRVALGELDPASDEVQSVAESTPAFRDELNDLVDCQSELERLRVERDEHLRVAGETQGAPGEARVAALMSELARDLPPRRQHDGRRMWTWAACVALAASVVLMVVLTIPGPEDIDPGPRLGSALQALEPQGAVERFEGFRWTYREPRGVEFEVLVYDGETGVLLARKAALRTTTWTPTPEEREDWRGSIRWEVNATKSGRLIDSDRASFELSP